MLRFLIPVDGSEPSTEAVKQLRTYLGWLKEEVEFHLLIMATRGMGSVSGALLGSVATKCCPRLPGAGAADEEASCEK